MLIFIGNLPGDTSEEHLAATFGEVAPMQDVRLIREGNPDSPMALFRLPYSREVAVGVAGRIDGHYHRGRRLNAWVALYGD